MASRILASRSSSLLYSLDSPPIELEYRCDLNLAGFCRGGTLARRVPVGTLALRAYRWFLGVVLPGCPDVVASLALVTLNSDSSQAHYGAVDSGRIP